MAVDLQHSTGDTSEFLADDDVLLLSHSQPKNNRNDMDDDFIAELTHHMDRFLLQDDDDDDKFDLSGIGYHNSELSWDLMGSPESTLWSPPLGSNSNSNQGSSEGSSQEASPPPTPDSCNWNTTFDLTGGIKLDETINSRSYHTNSHEILHSFNSSNINGLCSHQSLIQQQIRSIEFSRLKQEQDRSLKQKPNAYGESEGQIISQKSEATEEREINAQCQKIGKDGGSVGRRTRPPRPSSPMHQQQSGAGGGGMRAMFLGGSASRGGTGVFFPRSGTAAPPQSTKKQGKGCSTVLIPARVVQALQQHFDQMASTSAPKPGAFPPLHDVLVSNRDGMYSLQKRQSRKSVSPANIQNEVTLPQDWTY